MARPGPARRGAAWQGRQGGAGHGIYKAGMPGVARHGMAGPGQAGMNQDSFKLFEKHEHRVGVIVCTGPSLTTEQLDKVKHLKRFGANRTFEFDLDVIAGCNWQFWHHYWDQIKDCRCHKWATLDYEKVNHFPGLNYIQAKFMNGLSRDKS